MAAFRGHGLFRVPRCADQRPSNWGVPTPCHRAVATFVETTQPERPNDVGADGSAGERVAASSPCPSSLARRAPGRQTPKVGAVCLNRARTDLCGGCRATGIPTAIAVAQFETGANTNCVIKRSRLKVASRVSNKYAPRGAMTRRHDDCKRPPHRCSVTYIHTPCCRIQCRGSTRRSVKGPLTEGRSLRSAFEPNSTNTALFAAQLTL